MSPVRQPKFAQKLSWPPALVLATFFVGAEMLSGRYRFFSPTTTAVLALIALLLIAGIFYTEYRERLRAAVLITTILVLYATVLDIYGLRHLLVLLLSGGPKLHGAELLASGVYFWGCNVLTFGLWYWLIDRGGPHMRAKGRESHPDFLFPEMTAADIVDSRWHPGLIEYMYLSFTNATAFSPTDTLPLSSRARVLMTVESSMSLLTVALVTARAVNILS